MNAYELAKAQQAYAPPTLEEIIKQQADRIAELEKKPIICVGYWDNKTGAFHKEITKTQQKRVNDGFLHPVYTNGMLQTKSLSDEEIPVFGILHKAQSVPLGSAIWETDAEYEKLKKIVIASVKWAIEERHGIK